ncbi:extracellular solute-binding protein [Buttiauxella sp. A2-C2_NF]|uniref:extracellular solute-binding protein n=1 Tax=Buttiauxella ferragutiae TaxID=82989 RepID=UPI001E291E34|nr:extracellular solute-binding protein [Buttiauxella ferragutiae]MCE0828824.1 extracellular solute-binding protein [Buttiauxella ferragutiae]
MTLFSGWYMPRLSIFNYSIRRNTLLVFVTLMLGVLLSPRSQATDIEFWHGNTGSIEKAILAACDGFNQSQQRDKVTCVGQGTYETAMQKAIAGYRTRNNPTLIQLFEAGTLDLMLSGAVLPAQSVMPEVDWQDFIPGARSFYESTKGDIYSQPYNVSTLVLYVNKTQLVTAGINEIPTTWEEVTVAAQKLKAQGYTCPFVTDFNPWRLMEQFAARHGVPIASKNNGYDGLDAEYVFNQGIIADHLQNLLTWRQLGLVRLEGDTRSGNMALAFNTGECAMMETSTGSYFDAMAAFDKKYQLGVGLAPIYQGYERHNTLVGGASIWLMNNKSKAEIEAAKAFLDYLRQPEQQLMFSSVTGYLPVTQSAYSLLRQQDKQQDPRYLASLIGLESMSQTPNTNSRGIRLGFYVQFREIFKEEVQKAFSGKQSIPQALDRAKNRGDELLRRFAATYNGATLP